MTQSDEKPPCGRALRMDGPLARRHRVTLVGTGERVVMLSHGFGTDQSAWSAVLERLPHDLCFLLYDLPGAGPLLPADFDPGRYRSLSSFADDLLALLDEIGVHRLSFVGHSVSGMVGVLAALEDPDRFERLVLLNASPRYLDDGDYHGGFSRADLDGLLDAMAANYAAWIAGFAPVAVGGDVPHAVEAFSTGLLRMRPDVTLRIARAIFESDIRPLLGKLTTPTDLIHSHDDIAVPPSVATYMRDQIPGSVLTWIDATGHLPHLSAPGTVAAALRTMLNH